MDLLPEVISSSEVGANMFITVNKLNNVRRGDYSQHGERGLIDYHGPERRNDIGAVPANFCLLPAASSSLLRGREEEERRGYLAGIKEIYNMIY